jgi:hypothetical protein
MQCLRRWAGPDLRCRCKSTSLLCFFDPWAAEACRSIISSEHDGHRVYNELKGAELELELELELGLELGLDLELDTPMASIPTAFLFIPNQLTRMNTYSRKHCTQQLRSG